MSRFFDRRVAEAVTQCGKWLILQTIQEANKHGMDVVYCDTDSVFVAGATRTEFEVFVERCNEDLYPRVLKEVGCRENLINLAYEKQYERVIFCSMKKYAARYVHYKGTPADPATSKPEVKGLEYKRGDAIRFARELQAEVIELLVGYSAKGGCEDPLVYEKVLNRWRDRVINQPLALEDIRVTKRLQKPLDAYVRKGKKDGSGFARQLPHIEIARERAKQGHDVGEGVRIEYFIYDGGVTPMDCRDADLWDKPIDSSDSSSPTHAETVDRFVIWDKQTYPPTERLLEAAFPGHPWDAWRRTRPAKGRKPRARKA
jgi:DNA polymerase I